MNIPGMLAEKALKKHNAKNIMAQQNENQKQETSRLYKSTTCNAGKEQNNRLTEFLR
jgi:hypothetical protein